MQYDTYQSQGNKETNKIFPVLPGQEGKDDSKQVIAKSSQGNSNYDHQQIEEMLDCPLFQPAEKAEYQDYDRYNINQYHLLVSLNIYFR